MPNPKLQALLDKGYTMDEIKAENERLGLLPNALASDDYPSTESKEPETESHIGDSDTQVRRTLVGFDDPSFNTYRRKQLQATQQHENAGAGYWGSLGTAAENEWVAASGVRYAERSQTVEADPDWTVPKEEVKRLAETYTDKEAKFALAALNENDYKARLRDIDEDRQRNQKLRDAGLAGAAAQLTMSILDPTMLLAGFVTDGAAIPAKASRVGNILRAAGVTAAESAATEAMLYEGDTQKQPTDVIMAALSGGILGSGIGALKRIHHVGAGESPIKKLDDLDDVTNIASKELKHTEAKEAYLATKVDRNDDIKVSDSIEAHKVDLRARANVRIPKGRELANVRKSIKSLEGKLQKAEEAQRADVAAHWAKVGVTKGVKRKFDEARADVVASKHTPVIENIKADIERQQRVISETQDALKAKKEIKAFDKMSPKQQEKHLFPEGTPKRKEYRKAQIKAMREVSARTRAGEDSKMLAIRESSLTPETEKAPQEGGGGSVGAAKVLNPVDEIYNTTNVQADEDWMDEAVNREIGATEADGRNYTKYIPDAMLSDYTNLDQSKSIFVRALNRIFNENPQGNATGKTVSALSYINDKQIRRAGRNSIDHGYQMYLDEIGVNQVTGHMSSKHRHDFESKVAMAIKGNTDPKDLPKSIKLAAEGAANQFKVAGQLRRQHGERGFENLSSDANYYPDIMHSDAINNLLYNRGWGASQVKQLIAKGYRDGEAELSEAQAKVVAEIKYNNIMNSQLYDGDVKAIYRASSAAEAQQLLKDAKVPQDLIDNFFEDVLSKEDWKSVSNRARKTLKINWNSKFTHDGHTASVADVMNKNVSQVLEAYTNESSFGAALAEMGINSEGMLSRILSQSKKNSLNEMQGEGIADAAKIRDTEFQTLENCITMMKGKPLVDYSGKFGTFNRAGRMLLDATGILRLQQVGFSSIPELARGITSAGLAHIISAVPGAHVLRNPFSRYGGRDPETLKALAPDMEELEEIIGFVGEDNFTHSFSVRSDDFGSEASNRFMETIDNGLEGVRRIGSWTSGFHVIQGGLEKITARAMSRRLLSHAIGKKKLTAGLSSQLELAGMSKERLSHIGDWVKSNPVYQDFNGRKVRMWNFDKMPADMKRDLQVTLARIQNRNVQKGMVGELNSNWIGPIGRFLTQFKTFSLVSLEKQLIADARSNISVGAANLLWGIGLSYGAYSSQAFLRALGTDDPISTFQDSMSPKKLAWGVFNKHSQLAAGGLITDMASFLGLMPDSMLDTGRYGYELGNIGSIIPTAGVVTDAAKAVGSVAAGVGSLTGFNDDDLDDDTRDIINKARKVLPFTNTVLFGDYLKNALGDDE